MDGLEDEISFWNGTIFRGELLVSGRVIYELRNRPLFVSMSLFFIYKGFVFLDHTYLTYLFRQFFLVLKEFSGLAQFFEKTTKAIAASNHFDSDLIFCAGLSCRFPGLSRWTAWSTWWTVNATLG